MRSQGGILIKGVIINSDFKRYSLRLNLDRQIFNTLKSALICLVPTRSVEHRQQMSVDVTES